MSYWRDVAERVVRAFAQGVLAALTVGAETWDRGGVPWADALYIGAGCAVIALLLCLAGSQVGDPRSGSLLPAPDAGHAEPGLDAGAGGA